MLASMIYEASSALKKLGINKEPDMDDAMFVMLAAEAIRPYFPGGEVDSLLLDSSEAYNIDEVVAAIRELINSLDEGQKKRKNLTAPAPTQAQLASRPVLYEMTDSQLLATVGENTWGDIALCMQTDPEIFIYGSAETKRWDGTLAMARFICRKCVVRPMCLEATLNMRKLPKSVRVAGGLSRRELINLRYKRANLLAARSSRNIAVSE